MHQGVKRAWWVAIFVVCLGAASAWGGDPERPGRVPDLVPSPPPDRSAYLDEHIQRMFRTPHAMVGDERTPFANGMCVRCHGPEMDMFFDPATTPVERMNRLCLSCHEEGVRRHWRGSRHESAGLACVNCHQLHNERPRLLKADTQLEVCGTCHMDRRTDFLKPSHHPVPEGLIQCTDCHNPHGTTGPRKLIGATINETCYNCHAEKRGPFLWEHHPVRDDCVNCHDPHGSVHRPLLLSRPPLLCQQCHLGSHSQQALVGAGPDFRIQGQSCLNCHSRVHGSNHPRGNFLTR